MPAHLWYLIIVLIVIAILRYAVYVAYPIYHAISITKQLMNEAVPYEQHPADATLSFLVAGDSTAVGTGSKDPKNSTAGRLGQQFPNANVSNVSENGLRLEGLIGKLNALPADSHYDLVLIQIGANDIVNFTSYGDVRSRLDTVLDWADTHSSHTLVLTAGDVGLAPVFHFPLNVLFTSRTLAVRKIFQEEIAKHPTAAYVDLYLPKDVEPFNTNIPLYYAPDHFHPSDAGYALWYQKIQKEIPSDLSVNLSR